MVVQRGYRQPPSFHIDRLRQADPGYMFDVITNGFGAMPDYKAQIDAARPVADRRLRPGAAAEPRPAHRQRTSRAATRTRHNKQAQPVQKPEGRSTEQWR